MRNTVGFHNGVWVRDVPDIWGDAIGWDEVPGWSYVGSPMELNISDDSVQLWKRKEEADWPLMLRVDVGGCHQSADILLQDWADYFDVIARVAPSAGLQHLILLVEELDKNVRRGLEPQIFQSTEAQKERTDRLEARAKWRAEKEAKAQSCTP